MHPVGLNGIICVPLQTGSMTNRAKPPKPPPPPPVKLPVKQCEVTGCGRPHYAQGHCQSHHRQMLTTGELKPIRPYRPRSEGTRKFVGLRLSPATVEALQALAAEEGISRGAAIARVLEEWNVRRKRKPKKPRR